MLTYTIDIQSIVYCGQWFDSPEQITLFLLKEKGAPIKGTLVLEIDSDYEVIERHNNLIEGKITYKFQKKSIVEKTNKKGFFSRLFKLG